MGTDQKFSATDGLRLVQFTDGKGLAAYGSKFAETAANFMMVSL